MKRYATKDDETLEHETPGDAAREWFEDNDGDEVRIYEYAPMEIDNAYQIADHAVTELEEVLQDSYCFEDAITVIPDDKKHKLQEAIIEAFEAFQVTRYIKTGAWIPFKRGDV